MLEILGRYLYGNDHWYIDIVESEFTQTVNSNDLKKVKSMLKDNVTPIREKHIIEGAIKAVQFKRLDILWFLLTHDRARKCIADHHNLTTYRAETADWGLLGNICTGVSSLYKTNRNPNQIEEFDSLLTLAIREHASAMRFGNSCRNESLRLIDMLTSSKLFDINQACKITKIIKEITHRNRRPMSRRDDAIDDSWTEYVTETIIKTPIAMACEMGDDFLVQRLLKEPNIKSNLKHSSTQSFSTTQRFASDYTLNTSAETPLELAQKKGFGAIVGLLQKDNTGPSTPSECFFDDACPSPAPAAAAAASSSTSNNSLPSLTDGLSKTQSNENCFFHQSKDCSLLISKILKNDPGLTLLNLSSRNIATETLVKIFEALQKNHTVTTLDLSHVDLDLDSVAAMSQMLKINNSIKKLKIVTSSKTASIFSTNKFSGKGAALFAEALYVNTGLTELCLNNHQGLCLKLFAEALEKNQTLTKVELKGATFSASPKTVKEDQKKFRDCLDRNKKAAAQQEIVDLEKKIIFDL